jgi:hypothetical protein
MTYRRDRSWNLSARLVVRRSITMTTHHTTHRFRRLYPGLALIALLSSASSARGERARPERTAPRALEIFRALSEEFDASVSDDEIESSLSSPPCDATCMQTAQTLVRELVASRGRPRALILRHLLLANGYFASERESALATALLRTDPPRVIDAPNKTLALRSDLIGMINLERFGNGSGAPEHYEPSERELRELASKLDGDLAKGARLTVYGVLGAELWLGVQQVWSSLAAKEQRVVRRYALLSFKQPMPGAMYARLLGIDRADGDALRENDVAVLSPAVDRRSGADRRRRFADAYFKLGFQPLPWSMAR